jgi:inorganic pyrophosphatase/exopolyphosphatase
MARDELSDLSNNEKFNVLQKTLKSLVGTSKEFIKNKFSEQLKNLADLKKNKNIEKDLAEFRKTLSKEQNNLLDKELMKKVLMDNKDWKLNPKETYIQYAQLALSKDNPDIRLHEKYE